MVCSFSVFGLRLMYAIPRALYASRAAKARAEDERDAQTVLELADPQDARPWSLAGHLY
jgi:hypothetical protein